MTTLVYRTDPAQITEMTQQSPQYRAKLNKLSAAISAGFYLSPMASIKQVYYRNPIIRLKLILWQRFQSLISYVDTELQSILAAYPEETEQVANEIDSLASHLKDSNAINQSTLVSRVARNGQDENAYTKPTVATTNKSLDNYQPNGQRVAQDESVILNHNPVLKLIAIGSLRRIFTVKMRNPSIRAMRTGRTRSRRYRTYRRYATRY